MGRKRARRDARKINEKKNECKKKLEFPPKGEQLKTKVKRPVTRRIRIFSRGVKLTEKSDVQAVWRRGVTQERAQEVNEQLNGLRGLMP